MAGGVNAARIGTDADDQKQSDGQQDFKHLREKIQLVGSCKESSLPCKPPGDT